MSLVSPDVALFRLINAGSANPLFDDLMPWITDGGNVQWILAGVGVLLLGRAHWRRDPAAIRRAWWVVAVAGAAVVLNEWIGSQAVRPLIDRPRPPRALDDVRLLVGLGPSPSFPSSHASNTAAVAAAVIYGYGRWGGLLLVYAALVAYSRVYVGVHYPLDVLAGQLLGLSTATGLWRVTARWRSSDPEVSAPRPRARERGV